MSNRTMIEIGFASLSVLTRQLVIGEVERALNDTSVEYHRQTTKELQSQLAFEVQALKSFLDIAKKVEEDVKEINGNEDSSGNSASRQGLRTSSGGVDSGRRDHDAHDEGCVSEPQAGDPHDPHRPRSVP